MKEVLVFTPFVIDGETYETVLSPLSNSPLSLQIVFPFESSKWMRFKIYGKNGFLEAVESGPSSVMPIGPSKIYSSDQFDYWVTIDVYKYNPNYCVETLKIKKRLIEGYRVGIYQVT
eukprot:gene3658-4556_t